MKASAWNLYLVAAVFAGQYYFVSSFGTVPDSNIPTMIGVSAVAAVIAGIVMHRPAAWLGWSFVAAAVALYVAGDLVYASLEADGPLVPFPSTADWLYLAMYPAMVIGLTLVRRSIAPERRPSARVDAAIVGVASLAVLGLLYMNAFIDSQFFDTGQRAVAIAYPVLDAVLVAVAVRLLLVVPRVPAAFGFVSVGLVALMVGNAVFNVQSAEFAYQAGGAAELGWLVFVAFVAAGALHPSMAEALPTMTRFSEASRPLPLAVPIIAAAAVPVAHLRWGTPDDTTVTVAALVLLGGLLTVRIGRRTVRPDELRPLVPTDELGAEFANTMSLGEPVS